MHRTHARALALTVVLLLGTGVAACGGSGAAVQRLDAAKAVGMLPNRTS